MKILGISAMYHDAAACLAIDGEIVAAAQEERFTRKKHDMRIPEKAITFCLERANIKKDEIDLVVFYDNPLYTLDRYMKNILAVGSNSKEVIDRGFESMFGEKIWIHKTMNKVLRGKKNFMYVNTICHMRPLHFILRRTNKLLLLHLMEWVNGRQRQLVLERGQILR